ncbi:hypothetical protein CBR_g19893 [Chara braunii]|uniref:Histone-binding protein RBBP4-like N-terminal domain-containing protein n=1 Tax=Chara braunii TaxID=69332 RepID=A0A388KYY2_CHABU|nr:hypothetical protein CBR_g19893 [Chara braunii]|eukprot:GBG75259.1 hypothetical protein CBR_g19893 [Chara braunii]
MKDPGELSESKKYSKWKSLAPVLYDWFGNHALVWPSLTCRWGPVLDSTPRHTKQRVYLSEQTDGTWPNTIVVANAEVLKRRVAVKDDMFQFRDDNKPPFIKKCKTIIHPGEVNRLRELPQASNIVATHTDKPQVFVWNLDTQLARQTVPGAVPSRPDLVLDGHKENAEFALAACRVAPYLLSGGKDTEVVLWSIIDHVTSLNQARLPLFTVSVNHGMCLPLCCRARSRICIMQLTRNIHGYFFSTIFLALT